MMFQVKTPEGTYSDLRGLSKASKTPINPPRPGGLSKGSFPGTSLTVHSVHAFLYFFLGDLF